MTYKDNFVVEVKQNGKILRVKDDAVFLPFGSEYSLLLKNLNSKRASIKIHIDGEDVLDYSSLILDAHSDTELQGFLRGNVARNRFRFIHKTEQIQQHRGDRADDGLIRIEFAFEKPRPEPYIKKTIEEVHHYNHNTFPYTYYDGSTDWSYNNSQSSDGKTNDVISSFHSSTTPLGSSNKRRISNVTMDSLGVQNVSQIPNVDEGITVKGSEVNQQFNYSSIGVLEPSSVIVIALKGITQTGQSVSQPITTRVKLTCSSCGTNSKSSFKFCPSCGTFLE